MISEKDFSKKNLTTKKRKKRSISRHKSKKVSEERILKDILSTISKGKLSTHQTSTIKKKRKTSQTRNLQSSLKSRNTSTSLIRNSSIGTVSHKTPHRDESSVRLFRPHTSTSQSAL